MTLKPYYEHGGVTIYNGDCLDVLPRLPDNSVDLILTDPPYFKVKGDAWDNQWDKAADFLAWLDRVLVEFARILKANGSLYLFASPQMSARVECLIAGRFEILNSITWRKPYSRADGSEKEALRSFFPGSERIIFAEHFGSDSAAKGESGYEKKCDEIRGFIYEPIRKYLDDERKAAGIPHRAVISHLQMTGHDSHFFSSVQWKLPLADQYAAMRELFNRSGGDFLRKEYDELRKEYDELRKEYDELRKEYDELRRPFSVSAKVPYTDVWDFETVGNYPGKHVCEKPAAMLRHIISASSKPGAVVLDAFGGSGSTADAARSLGRRGISIELSESWCRRQAALMAQGMLPIR